MPLKALREPKRAELTHYGSASTQVFGWPVALERSHALIGVLACLIILLGIHLIATSVQVSDIYRMTAGLVIGTGGSVILVILGVLHGTTAREIRFTRESLIIRQTGHKELILPFCEYQHEWVADLSNERLVRLIVFGRNRGCSLLLPEQWVLDGLREISRIQAEEGWYEPEY